MEIINRQLFNRSEDDNWETICSVCCGLSSYEEIDEKHRQVFDLIKNLLNQNTDQFNDYLIEYLNQSIDCYKNRDDALLKVFLTFLSIIDFNIQYKNTIIINFFGQNQLHFKTKFILFNNILEILSKNYKHLAINESFNFDLFIEKSLENDSTDEELIKCFDLMLRIDYQLIDENKLNQIIIKCIPNHPKKLIIEKNQFFCTLFEIYFKIRKFTKIHKILFNTTDIIESKLYFNQQFMKLYGKCIHDLPVGQLLDIFKLFLDTFNAKTINIFLIDLMTCFLHHIKSLDTNIASHSITLMNELLNETKRYLKSTSKLLTVENQDLSESLLGLYFAWTSVSIMKIVYNTNEGNSELIEKIKPSEWWDMSFVYDFSEKKKWQKLFYNRNEMRLTFKQIMIKVFTQKLEFLNCLSYSLELSAEQKLTIESSITELISGIYENFVSNLYLLNDRQLNAVFIHSKRKDLCMLSESMINSNTMKDLRGERFFLNNNFWENIEFQTAMIGSFWKQINVLNSNRKRKLDEENPAVNTIINLLVSSDILWIESASEVPNFPNLSQIWNIIKSAADLLENVEPNSVNGVTEITVLMKLFADNFPLEYLLTSNQMRCLICLSAVVFSLDAQKSNDQINTLLNLIIDSILRIFDGFRSVWLFNFVNPSDYIIKFLKILNNFENREKSKILINLFIDSLIKNKEPSDVEELKVKINENEDKLSFETLIMIESALLKRCIHIMNLKSVPKKLVKIKESLGPLSRELSNTVHNRIKSYLMKSEQLETIDSILIVESFATVFQFQLSKSSNEESIHLKSKWRKLLAKLIDISLQQLNSKTINESFVAFLKLLCSERKKLSNVLPEDFILNLWQVLCQLNDDKSEAKIISFNKYHLNQVMYESEKSRKLSEKIISSKVKDKHLFLDSIESQCYFLTKTQPLIIEIFKCSTKVEFDQIIESLINNFKNRNILSVSYNSFLLNALFLSDFHLTPENFTTFKLFINDLLILIVSHCQTCNLDDYNLSHEIQLYIKVPLLKIMRSIIHITKNNITSPQLFLSYNACIESKLDQYTDNPEIFIQLFQTIYSVLNEVLLQHKYLTIASISTFNLLVENLMKSLMIASNEQKFIELNTDVKHSLEVCSKNMDRLLTLMSSLETDCPSFATHLVAIYVTQTESVSVHQTVKKNILSGIYRLVKAIKDKDMLEMIHCRLSQPSRQIFKVIYDNYEHYYKFKGQI